MKTLTIRVNDTVKDQFIWLLDHFSPDEIRILEQGEYIDEDTYLRSIEGMVKSILEARSEPLENGAILDKLEW